MCEFNFKIKIEYSDKNYNANCTKNEIEFYFNYNVSIAECYKHNNYTLFYSLKAIGIYKKYNKDE